jgi:uncharacterized protein YyaL (SSP411 family)
VSRRFAGRASVALAALLLCAVAPDARADPPHTPAQFLGVAETELAATQRAFWNAQDHWYDWRLTKADSSKPLASLWDVFPLFELVDAIAIASPTAAHKAEVEAVGKGAEAYLDQSTDPPAFTTYPGVTNPAQHVYFDDNGWFETAFLDAYQATGDRRFLHDAEEAYTFIAEKGWNPAGGGFWWETLHRHLTAEPLATEIDTGLRLYEITHEQSYLTSAEHWLAWANRDSWNASEHLYQRNPTDATTMDYVEGPMIGAELELCAIRHVKGPCTAAESLAAASVARFGTDLNWTPAADALFLRYMLQLSATDHDPEWYDLAHQNAEDAIEHARDTDGLFFKRWNGGSFPTRLLQPDAATLSLFAWLAVFTHG